MTTRWYRYLLPALMLWLLVSCSSTKEEVSLPLTPPSSPLKIRVVNVSNHTEELFDVDVIGMLWTALEDSLKKRGMLWTPDTGGIPLALEASITEYQKGNAWIRPVLPMWGKTVLAAKADLQKEGHPVASAEAKRVISIGSDVFTRGAWQKVFSSVAEDLVKELTHNM